MDQLDYPSKEVWIQRREWFEQLFDVEKYPGAGFLLGEQATGLLVDLQAAYCGGAFIACVLLAGTIIDCHIREVEGAPEGGMQAAFAISTFQNELQWLRKRRNRLVHFKASKDPVITVDNHYQNRLDHERDAKKAIDLVARVFFENPCI